MKPQNTTTTKTQPTTEELLQLVEELQREDCRMIAENERLREQSKTDTKALPNLIAESLQNIERTTILQQSVLSALKSMQGTAPAQK